MKIDALARLERHAKRLAEIAAVLGRYGLADLFGGFKYAWLQDRLKSSDGKSLTEGVTQAARVRMALTELGTTFIKLGQMLSTRADLIGPEMTEELSELQSNVPPDAASVARATIEKELGHPIEELFAQFDDEPLAAASVAQVHAALLHTGQSVVVKVRRAGVAEQAATDLEIVQALATQQGTRRFLVTQPYFHDHADTYEYRKQLPVSLKTGEAASLRLLIGEEASQSTAWLRLGLHGANQAYVDVSLTININGQRLHDGSAAKHLVVTTGKRHGIASCPPTEAYAQWAVPVKHLKQGWNDLQITLQHASKPLKLVETEITLQP